MKKQKQRSKIAEYEKKEQKRRLHMAQRESKTIRKRWKDKNRWIDYYNSIRDAIMFPSVDYVNHTYSFENYVLPELLRYHQKKEAKKYIPFCNDLSQYILSFV